VALQNQVQSLSSEISTARDQRNDTVAAQISSEFEKVRAQIGTNGHPAYPEMYDATFWKEASPRALELIAKGTAPGDALRRVHYLITGRYVPAPSTQTRPASNSNTQHSNRSIAANGSVRGSTSAASMPHISSRNIGDNESPEESARIALEELQRGIG
jgi:hypothetical protein